MDLVFNHVDPRKPAKVQLVLHMMYEGQQRIPLERRFRFLEEDLPTTLLLGVGLLVIRKIQMKGNRQSHLF
jgi:hypothetical protein